MARTNYVLIDYENTQPSALEALEREHVRVMLFVGASQSRITFGVAAAMQRMGLNASYVKMTGNGKNALDFHIAYYIGQLSAADPSTFFHIVSKDGGFDPLIAHLKTRKIHACRSPDVSEIPFVKAASMETPSEKHAFLIARLQKMGAARPRSVKSLTSTITAMFHGAVKESEVPDLIKVLEANRSITVANGKVSYGPPAAHV